MEPLLEFAKPIRSHTIIEQAGLPRPAIRRRGSRLCQNLLYDVSLIRL
jgi:hypothetical protein